MANAANRPKPPKGYAQGPPRDPVRRPSTRHSIANLRPRDFSDSHDRNTMIEPRIDVGAEIEAINRGEGYCDKETGQIWINGRLWGTHTDRTTGTLFPIEGDGFIPITSIQHYAFRTFVRYNASLPRLNWRCLASAA